MTAGPPTEPPILTAEEIAAVMLNAAKLPAYARDLSRQGGGGWEEDARPLLRDMADLVDALRARLLDAEETLRRIADRRNLYASFLARAYFKWHADPQEKP